MPKLLRNNKLPDCLPESPENRGFRQLFSVVSCCAVPKVLRIARREYIEAIRTKAFIIGLLLGPFLMSGSAIVFAIFKDRVDTTDKRLAVVDRSGIVAAAIVQSAQSRNAGEIFDQQTGNKVQPEYIIEVVPPDEGAADSQLLELSNRVRRGELHSFVEIGAGVLHPRQNRAESRIAYYAQNPALDDLRKWVGRPIDEELRRLRLAEVGIDESEVEDVFDWLGAEPLGLVSADLESGNIQPPERRSELEAILPPLILPMIMLLLIMIGAAPLLHSVMEEKSQRIAEVMLGSVRPFDFLLGKVIGGVSVSLTAAAVYIAGGIAAAHYMGFAEHIPYHLLPWFLAYLVMALLMFGALFAALGSACNDASEAQSMSLPGMLPVIFPMFVQMPVVIHPQSAFATGLSLFPLFTPMLMLIRQGTPGGVPVWQPWVGLIGVALTTLLLVWVAGRIFRTGILMQGTPPKLGNIIRWVVCNAR